MRLSLVALSLPLLCLATPPFPVFGPPLAIPEGIPVEDPMSLEPAYRVLQQESVPESAGTKEKRFWDRFSAQTKDHFDGATAYEKQLQRDIAAMERNRLGRRLLAKRQTTTTSTRPPRYIPPRSSQSPRTFVQASSSVQTSSSLPRTTSTTPVASTSQTTTAVATTSTTRTSTVVTTSTPRTTTTSVQTRPPPPVAPTAPAIYPGNAPLGFNYGTDKIRGVNLGGWLVLEAFISPSMFTINFQDNRIVDEYTLTQYGDYNTVYDSLLQHWSTWITEDDIRQIAAAGLNHVRIPVGFWAIDVQPGEPYLQGSLFFLTQAVGWAKKYGVKVMIDLHGVPGSQNGFDNSGRRGPILWQSTSQNLERSRNVLFALSNEFSKQQYFNTVTSIQAVNEPQGYLPSLMAILKQYYYDAYFIIRFHYTSQPNNILVVIHDAFQGTDFWNGFMNYRDNFQAVSLDTHIYSMFSDQEISFTDNERIGNFCQKVDGLVRSNNNLWTFVGEWTAATTDCAGKIPGVVYGPNNPNAIGGPSRYERLGLGNCNTRTGSGANYSAAYKNTLRRFFEAQVQIYERASGWIMWTWKMEPNAEDWSYQAGLRYGWIPQDPTARAFPPACQ